MADDQATGTVGLSRNEIQLRIRQIERRLQKRKQKKGVRLPMSAELNVHSAAEPEVCVLHGEQVVEAPVVLGRNDKTDMVLLCHVTLGLNHLMCVSTGAHVEVYCIPGQHLEEATACWQHKYLLLQKPLYQSAEAPSSYLLSDPHQCPDLFLLKLHWFQIDDRRYSQLYEQTWRCSIAKDDSQSDMSAEVLLLQEPRAMKRLLVRHLEPRATMLVYYLPQLELSRVHIFQGGRELDLEDGRRHRAQHVLSLPGELLQPPMFVADSSGLVAGFVLRERCECRLYQFIKTKSSLFAKPIHLKSLLLPWSSEVPFWMVDLCPDELGVHMRVLHPDGSLQWMTDSVAEEHIQMVGALMHEEAVLQCVLSSCPPLLYLIKSQTRILLLDHLFRLKATLLFHDKIPDIKAFDILRREIRSDRADVP